MATYDYLRKQALVDIWRMPGIDRQFIIKPQRVSRKYGVRKRVDIVWETLSLPDGTSNWHVYDAGPVSIVTLNLFKRCNGWSTLSDATNNRGVYLNAYVESGVELPRFDTFYRYTNSGSLIFAVRVNKKLIPNLDIDNFYLRVYSGAALNINRLPAATDLIKTFGTYVTVPADIDNFQSKLDLLPTTGETNLYHNGIWYSDLSSISIKVGDWIEFIYDSSFYKSYEFAVRDLPHYNSTMDSDQKYLLHYPGVSDVIDFYDDIDIYVYQKENGVPLRGVYFHKNDERSVRQLTHRDFGLRTNNLSPISRVLQSLKEPVLTAPIETLFIKLIVRRSNVEPNKLVYENTRLFELYKLSDTDILRAMQGIDSTVPFWTAPELEKSYYTLAMRTSYNGLTEQLAEKTFGYNAAAKIVGNTPTMLTVVGPQDIKLPIRMQHGCTMYEYDSEGLLINWYQHLGGITYRPKHLETVYLEGIVGLGGDRLDQLHNKRQAILNDVYTYRVYNSTKIGNVVQSDFEDVTGSNKYTITDKVFNWTSPRLADYPVVMSDAKFYAKDFAIRSQFGMITITLVSQQERPTGDGYYNMLFPMGQMDVFLNRYSLIKDLDYFIDFPRIHIVNKEFLIDPLAMDQAVHVRFCGFATKDFEITSDGDVGFIEHGFLSNNNKYDIRDDKVQRVVIGGKLYDKSELMFSEEHQGVSITDPANGLPYMVKDILVPIKPYTVGDMYELRKQSQDIDAIVSDYLTLKLPQPTRSPLMAIPNRYKVFSPFTNKIITDLRLNSINIPIRVNGFSKQEVIDICKPYEYLLKFDPIRSPNLQDVRFIEIHPHGYPQILGISPNAYRFMNKVVELYCDGLVELSSFLKTV